MSGDSTFLIHDALVIPEPGAGREPFWGYVRVERGVIAEVGPGDGPRFGAGRRIGGRERAVLPGLVNAHAHSHSSLTRGSAEGLALDQWIATIEREQRRLTDEQAYWGAMATYAEGLLSGTTAILDMCLRPEPVVEAARKLGIRAAIAPYAADSKPFAPTLAQTETLLQSIARPDERVQIFVGLHDLESCSDEQIRAGAALASRRGTRLHLHCAETRGQVERTRARTGRSPVAQLEALGALDARTVLAHCVWVDAEDCARLVVAKAHAVHCPHANLKLGSGIAPIRALTGVGGAVALGTDGAKANNRLDMFDVMKFASLIHKGALTDPTVLPPDQILGMATRAGAQALGLSGGAIRPGLPADLTLVRLDRLHLQPAEPDTIVTNLVHAARGSDVDMVMVGGRLLVEDGALTSADHAEILTQASAIGRALLG